MHVKDVISFGKSNALYTQAQQTLDLIDRIQLRLFLVLFASASVDDSRVVCIHSSAFATRHNLE